MKQQETNNNTITLRNLISNNTPDLFYNVYDINTRIPIYRIDNFMNYVIDTITSEELKTSIESENKKIKKHADRIKKLLSECDNINEE